MIPSKWHCRTKPYILLCNSGAYFDYGMRFPRLPPESAPLAEQEPAQQRGDEGAGGRGVSDPGLLRLTLS